jgi:hypothetical protein
MDLTPTLRELVRRRGFNAAERETIGVLLISIVFVDYGRDVGALVPVAAHLAQQCDGGNPGGGAAFHRGIDRLGRFEGRQLGHHFCHRRGLSLGDALDKSGASAWIVSLVEPALSGLPYLAILALLVTSTFVLTQFMNSVTYGAILSPILVTLAVTTEIMPTRLVLPFVFTLALCYMLPNSSARMTLVAISGAVDTNDLLRSGLLVGLPSALFVFLFFAVLSVVGLI